MTHALDVAGLCVSLGGREVLHEVSFALEPGAFCGLIGANGSGKTTLLRSILGFTAPSAGRVALAGVAGYVPQKLQLDPDMPVRAGDFVELGLNGHRFGFPFPSRARRAKVEAMLAAVGAEAFAGQRIGELSGGQQQRVLIAHALIRQPKLLLLDEPLANLDLRASAEIIALLKRVAAQGVTVLLSAHDMNPLLSAMDRIVYLAKGRAASGRTQEVVRTEVLSALYGYHIDVIRVHDRIIVVAGEGGAHGGKHVAAIP
ncbi:metal ABC transporter ATP-binding protein [Acidocella sp. KAb 2-4]|uniref:metal ABC transporter ATP-binding protein n=1 Tax=Acidocella sp. KAb 2-4 TaxID=2885158 RepID=UPI001D098B36|nr:metal ABC transporter ATP-binding protein [Acidocella sp. KAb 2-4]MCB5944813.1 metal ABC transporter ATP-binding protein [Acidocella sp. KAb 2-4]